MASKEDVENWIKDIMNERGIYKYKIEIAGSTEKGDGYLGLVNFIKVVTSKDGKETLYNMVVKSAKKGVESRKQIPIQECYDR